MTIGGGLFLIAVGAVLKFAVTATIVGIDIQVLGVILMVIGVIVLAFGTYIWIASGRAAPPGGAPPNNPPY